MDISRISSGKIQLKKELLDLSEVIRQAAEMNQSIIDAREQKLNITRPSIKFQVKGDFTRLAQVVGNLINNAAKYTVYGETISVTIEQGKGSTDTRHNMLICIFVTMDEA